MLEFTRTPGRYIFLALSCLAAGLAVGGLLGFELGQFVAPNLPEHVLEEPLIIVSEQGTGVLPAGTSLRQTNTLFTDRPDAYLVQVNVFGAPLPTREVEWTWSPLQSVRDEEGARATRDALRQTVDDATR